MWKKASSFKRKEMPYRTPDASSYTMIKRLQTDISGQNVQGPYKFKAPPLTYGGYFAGLANIKSLPVNALLSNKFIQPSQPSGASVIDVDFLGDDNVSNLNVSLSTTFNFRFKNLVNYDDVNVIGFNIDSYDFTGSTASIEGITITNEDTSSIARYFVYFDPNQLTENTIITITLPSSVSSFDSIFATQV
jgi:hypothetical protein